MRPSPSAAKPCSWLTAPRREDEKRTRQQDDEPEKNERIGSLHSEPSFTESRYRVPPCPGSGAASLPRPSRGAEAHGVTISPVSPGEKARPSPRHGRGGLPALVRREVHIPPSRFFTSLKPEPLRMHEARYERNPDWQYTTVSFPGSRSSRRRRSVLSGISVAQSSVPIEHSFVSRTSTRLTPSPSSSASRNRWSHPFPSCGSPPPCRRQPQDLSPSRTGARTRGRGRRCRRR